MLVNTTRTRHFFFYLMIDLRDLLLHWMFRWLPSALRCWQHIRYMLPSWIFRFYHYNYYCFISNQYLALSQLSARVRRFCFLIGWWINLTNYQVRKIAHIVHDLSPKYSARSRNKAITVTLFSITETNNVAITAPSPHTRTTSKKKKRLVRIIQGYLKWFIRFQMLLSF